MIQGRTVTTLGVDPAGAEGSPVQLIPIAIFVIVAAWGAYTFNRLVKARNLVREAWSGIAVQLKRRYDLIPNLVEVVQDYGEYEREVFTEVTRRRARAGRARTPAEQSEAEKDLSGGLRSLLAVAEDYPQVKANRNFLDLQRNLSEVEDQIQYARRYYNGTVRDLNNLVESFPSMLVAWLCRFQRAEFFEIEYATEREVPDVELSTDRPGPASTG